MIEDKLLQYLFRHKVCPLPAVGTLELVDGNATAWHSEHKMMAPVPFVILSHTETDPGDLIRYIAAEEIISTQEADDRLLTFCDNINRLDQGAEKHIRSLGTFFIDETGKPGFRQDPLPVDFFPELPVKRVVRQDAVHNMRVGDQETNSQEMAEYFQEQGKVSRERWWIWAAALFLLSAGIITFYFTGKNHQPLMGNAGNIQAGKEPSTYTKGN